MNAPISILTTAVAGFNPEASCALIGRKGTSLRTLCVLISQTTEQFTLPSFNIY